MPGHQSLLSERKASHRDTPRVGRENERVRRAGITIIELMIVLAMIAIIAAMGAPKLNTSAYKSDACARLIRGTLQVAQRNAITRQSNVVVSFDAANNRLRVLEDANDNGTVDAGERVTNVPLDEGTRMAIPSMGRVGGATAATAVLGTALRTFDGMPSIIFRRDGSASSDVELYITTRTSVVGDYRALLLTPSTGTVDQFRYTGSIWKRTSQ